MKRFALIISLAFLLSACGGSSSQPTSTAASSTTQAEQVKAEMPAEKLATYEHDMMQSMEYIVEEMGYSINFVMAEFNFQKDQQNPSSEKTYQAGLEWEKEYNKEHGSPQQQFSFERATIRIDGDYEDSLEGFSYSGRANDLATAYKDLYEAYYGLYYIGKEPEEDTTVLAEMIKAYLDKAHTAMENAKKFTE